MKACVSSSSLLKASFVLSIPFVIRFYVLLLQKNVLREQKYDDLVLLNPSLSLSSCFSSCSSFASRGYQCLSTFYCLMPVVLTSVRLHLSQLFSQFSPKKNVSCLLPFPFLHSSSLKLHFLPPSSSDITSLMLPLNLVLWLDCVVFIDILPLSSSCDSFLSSFSCVENSLFFVGCLILWLFESLSVSFLTMLFFIRFSFWDSYPFIFLQ